ncbi:MAG: transposase [Phycisphaerales bacterium]|nr:transposase [Phycisphaerales bacterium]
MPSAYTQNFYHTVFSTKHRAMLITPDLEERLYPFMGGILRDLRCTLLVINGGWHGWHAFAVLRVSMLRARHHP